MKEYIQSREVVEMAVTVLLDGVKSKVAVKQSDHSLQLQPHSILTQYLNPYKERQKSTPRIADALTLTLEYYLNSEGRRENLYFRTILFIYVISGIDLSYLYSSLTSRNKNIVRLHREKLLKLADALFHAFDYKTEVKTAELRNLVYKNAFDESWHIETGCLDIPLNVYANFMNGYWEYRSLSISQKRRLPSTAKRIRQQITWTMELIFDLLESESLSDFIKKHPDIESYTSSIENNKKWKVRILGMIDNTPLTFNILEWVVRLACELWSSNRYEELSSFLKKYELKLNEIQSNFSQGKYKRSKADMQMLESNLFQKITRLFDGMVQYISLQDRVNTELGVFGSNQVRNDFQVSPPIQSIRQLIRIMISFLFNGVETKTGKEDADLSGQLKEIRSVVLHRYLNTPGAKFTYKIADGLYYRIQYYFYPEKRSEDNELSVTPAQFGELLWQFMYYAFGIDFYMLRIDEINSKQQIEEWCSLAETLLNKIKEIDSLPESEKLPVLRETMMKHYSQLQIDFEETHPIRFTLEEIDYFRAMEVIADKKYQEIIQREKHGDENKEAIEMAAQITTFLCRKKCVVAFNKIKEAIGCLEYILKARELKDIEDEYPGAIKEIALLSNNNKYNIYASMKNKTGERVSVSKYELNELFSYVAVSITANRYELCHIDREWIKKRLGYFMKKLSECENTDYGLKLEPPTKKDFIKHFNEVNENLFRCEEVKHLKLVIQYAYKYVLYSEWIDNNMHLYFG